MDECSGKESDGIPFIHLSFALNPTFLHPVTCRRHLLCVGVFAWGTGDAAVSKADLAFAFVKLVV